MTRIRKWLPALIGATAISFISPPPCFCGSFLINSNLGGTVEAILHPFLYVGAGGPLTVSVCTSPSFAEIDSAEPAIVRAIATWNSLAFQNNNLEQTTPEGFADFETIMTTYSRDLMDLPARSLFAANANRLSGPASSPPVLDTESIMNGIFFEGDRIHEIQADDFSIIALGQAGLDGISGTADDYSVTLNYLGRMDDETVCQVIIVSSSEAPIPPARCNVSSISIGVGTNHFRLAGNGLITVSENINWYFGDEIFANGFETGTLSEWSGAAP